MNAKPDAVSLAIRWFRLMNDRTLHFGNGPRDEQYVEDLFSALHAFCKKPVRPAIDAAELLTRCIRGIDAGWLIVSRVKMPDRETVDASLFDETRKAIGSPERGAFVVERVYEKKWLRIWQTCDGQDAARYLRQCSEQDVQIEYRMRYDVKADRAQNSRREDDTPAQHESPKT